MNTEYSVFSKFLRNLDWIQFPVPANCAKPFVPSYCIRPYLLVRRSSLVQSVATILQRMALLFFSESDLWMRQLEGRLWSGFLHYILQPPRNGHLPTFLPGKLSIHLSSLNPRTTYFLGPSSLILPDRIGCWTWVLLSIGGFVLSTSVLLSALFPLKYNSYVTLY